MNGRNERENNDNFVFFSYNKIKWIDITRTIEISDRRMKERIIEQIDIEIIALKPIRKATPKLTAAANERASRFRSTANGIHPRSEWPAE